MNGQLFKELRSVGFAVAYRRLGSVSEAEDIVQEAFLRLHHTLADGERIESPRAYLSTVVSRLSLDEEPQGSGATARPLRPAGAR